MKSAEKVTEEINQIFIGIAEWEIGLDIEEKIIELLTTWKEDICKKQRVELLQQSRRVRNYSEPNDVYYAVPVSLIKNQDEQTSEPT